MIGCATQLTRCTHHIEKTPIYRPTDFRFLAWRGRCWGIGKLWMKIIALFYKTHILLSSLMHRSTGHFLFAYVQLQYRILFSLVSWQYCWYWLSQTWTQYWVLNLSATRDLRANSPKFLVFRSMAYVHVRNANADMLQLLHVDEGVRMRFGRSNCATVRSHRSVLTKTSVHPLTTKWRHCQCQ